MITAGCPQHRPRNTCFWRWRPSKAVMVIYLWSSLDFFTFCLFIKCELLCAVDPPHTLRMQLRATRSNLVTPQNLFLSLMAHLYTFSWLNFWKKKIKVNLDSNWVCEAYRNTTTVLSYSCVLKLLKGCIYFLTNLNIMWKVITLNMQ